jgi:chemotaxis family two-component system response regulator Rcp1
MIDTSLMHRAGRPDARTLEILLVEDEPGDAYLAQEALKSAGVPLRVHVAEDGVEALAFLRRTGPHAQSPRPDLILLDLNLPRKDGREVLSELKQDPTLAAIPVVVLTTSKAEQDILRCYQLHANCCVNKPVNLDQFLTVVRETMAFWLKTVTLPPGESPS